MSQILLGVLKQYVNSLFNIERKLCKATKHKQLLLTYKKSKKYPKGMRLRFHLSLCNHDNKLKDVCSKLEILEQNVTIIVIISKIKLPEKIINLLRN